MKAMFQKATQNFSRSIIQPVMFMAVTGLIISIAAVLKLEIMPIFLREIGNGVFSILSSSAIGQLSVIFCVGIATAMAKKKKTDAAILGITIYLVFLYANNYWLTFTHRLAEAGEQGLFGTGQNIVLGVQVTDMGVFLGIILGCVVGYFVNKLGDVKFHQYLAPYEGTKFAYAILIFVTVIFAILITYIWPPINEMINAIVGSMNHMGSIGFFMYGFLNRMLLPVGMHHLLWMPLYYTPLGGTAAVAGETFHGAMNIWLAELGNMSSVTAIDNSVGYLVNFGYTALPIGIALALIKTAKPENRAKMKAILIPAAFAALFAGITEPIEFLFLFVSPLLWFIHAVIYGFGLFFANVLGLKVMVENLINTIMYSAAVPMSLGRQWLIPIIFVLLVLIEYFAFTFVIKKFNIPTLGRTDDMDEIVDENPDPEQNEGQSRKGEEDGKLDLIIEGLGGAANIENINNCFTRLRIDIYDPEKVEMDVLKQYPSSGVVDKGKHIQIIVGLGVQDVRDQLEDKINRSENLVETNTN